MLLREQSRGLQSPDISPVRCVWDDECQARPRGSTSVADLTDALVAEPAAKFQRVVEKPR